MQCRYSILVKWQKNDCFMLYALLDAEKQKLSPVHH